MNNISLNDMPYDILSIIYNKVCLMNTPIYNYRIRYINKTFMKIVDKHKGDLCQNLDDNILDKLIIFGLPWGQ